MSTKFFQPFEKIYYRFGDEVSFSLFQNLSQYVDIIDQVKSQTAFYEDYTIKSGDRPDTLSLQLYGDPKYYWTFYLLNDDLRESGWPLKNEDVIRRAKEFYPHRVLTFNTDISSSEGGYDYRVGRQLKGNRSGIHGTIIKRNLDLGQLIVDTQHSVDPITPDRVLTIEINSNGAADIELSHPQERFHSTDLWILNRIDLSNSSADPELITGYTIELSNLNTVAKIRSIPFKVGNFRYELTPKINHTNTNEDAFEDGEIVSWFDPSTGLTVDRVLQKDEAQYLAVHHYENSNGEHVDIDPDILYNTSNLSPSQSYPAVVPSGLKAITNLSRLQKKNDDLKQIKVLKSETVETVVKEFYRFMQER